jgi:hypothetical protein
MCPSIITVKIFAPAREGCPGSNVFEAKLKILYSALEVIELVRECHKEVHHAEILASRHDDKNILSYLFITETF